MHAGDRVRVREPLDDHRNLDPHVGAEDLEVHADFQARPRVGRRVEGRLDRLLVQQFTLFRRLDIGHAPVGERPPPRRIEGRRIEDADGGHAVAHVVAVGVPVRIVEHELLVERLGVRREIGLHGVRGGVAFAAAHDAEHARGLGTRRLFRGLVRREGGRNGHHVLGQHDLDGVRKAVDGGRAFTALATLALATHALFALAGGRSDRDRRGIAADLHLELRHGRRVLLRQAEAEEAVRARQDVRHARDGDLRAHDALAVGRLDLAAERHARAVQAQLDRHVRNHLVPGELRQLVPGVARPAPAHEHAGVLAADLVAAIADRNDLVARHAGDNRHEHRRAGTQVVVDVLVQRVVLLDRRVFGRRETEDGLERLRQRGAGGTRLALRVHHADTHAHVVGRAAEQFALRLGEEVAVLRLAAHVLRQDRPVVEAANRRQLDLLAVDRARVRDGRDAVRRVEELQDRRAGRRHAAADVVAGRVVVVERRIEGRQRPGAEAGVVGRLLVGLVPVRQIVVGVVRIAEAGQVGHGQRGIAVRRRNRGRERVALQRRPRVARPLRAGLLHDLRLLADGGRNGLQPGLRRGHRAETRADVGRHHAAEGVRRGQDAVAARHDRDDGLKARVGGHEHAGPVVQGHRVPEQRAVRIRKRSHRGHRRAAKTEATPVLGRPGLHHRLRLVRRDSIGARIRGNRGHQQGRHHSSQGLLFHAHSTVSIHAGMGEVYTSP